VVDNHLGYIGFSNSDNSLRENRAIDKVISRWNIPSFYCRLNSLCTRKDSIFNLTVISSVWDSSL
jgi:hypothetical protein